MTFFDLAIFIIVGAGALLTMTLLGASAVSLFQGSEENCPVSRKENRETTMICKGEQTRQLM
ncbi:MAG: hypothetical protein V3V10_02630 [Planctomycetota bacterium]